jgi:DNA-directed RNA polymerase specialized sigma24 family protein
MLESTHIVDGRAAPYRTGTDFCKIFAEEMNSLYLLAFLLTADSDKAEQCFVCALGECVEETGAFMEWAHSWARRTIIKQAIQMIMPAPERVDQVSFVSLNEASVSGKYNPMGAIVALSAFERFVFVMSILEDQSDEDCAILLGCSRRDVMIAREVALRRLTHSRNDCDRVAEGAGILGSSVAQACIHQDTTD